MSLCTQDTEYPENSGSTNPSHLRAADRGEVPGSGGKRKAGESRGREYTGPKDL